MAASYLNFNIDIKDKSERQTSLRNVGVRRTKYGTGTFNGHSKIVLNQFANMNWQDQLFVKLKFKFDRFKNKFDYGGQLPVDGGWSSDVLWKYDHRAVRKIIYCFVADF